VRFRRVRDQEARSRKREERQRDRLERLEKMVYAQHEKLDRLEDLVYRVMHRDRVNLSGNEQRSPPRRSETEATFSKLTPMRTTRRIHRCTKTMSRRTFTQFQIYDLFIGRNIRRISGRCRKKADSLSPRRCPVLSRTRSRDSPGEVPAS
jgi:hypothetical protein